MTLKHDDSPNVYSFGSIRIRTNVQFSARSVEAPLKETFLARLSLTNMPKPALGGHRVAAAQFNASEGIEHTQISAERFHLSYFGIADAQVDLATRELVIGLDPDAHPEWGSTLLAGGMMGFLLTVLGKWPLHASAVEVADRRYAFIGASGYGKTAIAAALCGNGAKLIAEDLLVVDEAGVAHTASCELRLRPCNAALADRFPAAWRRKTVDGRTGVNCLQQAGTAGPLNAFVLPDITQDGPERMELAQLDGIEAFQALIGVPRQIGLLDASYAARALPLVERWLSTIPVLRLSMARNRLLDPAMPHELVTQLGAI